ncbi:MULTISPECIES: hypothetical protein [Haloarcula]|uniref:CopG family transcriptional regulator n=1 Tax=Haloarcula pellucida TaxID=1427151 RepID=A0A830GQ25_9EURY|nr:MULTISPECIES: hypothetical protein [Halomicroarcula]MBX0348356.1 hypothetical protein [Halomicroarcula pellucida]MDS0278177.1 hypothetical protein [Halomicroarcula sp. S1AR25-4]GGN98142.1 hypothetical protein GCM10009030_28240 [Halomicroarcula pellucida]
MPRSDVPAESVTRVELPTALVDDVEQRLQYTDFEDASAYVEFVVEEVLASVSDGEDASYDAVDREEVESRLESLGYME